MNRILAAVDLSEVSKTVVARAIEMARATNGKVTLLHAVNSPPAPPLPATPVSTQLGSVVASAESSVRALLETVPAELRDGFVIELGTAAEAICRTARTSDAGVVVIGAHRYGRLARALGTTAARVVNIVDRPVFVVRPTVHAATTPVTSLREEHRQLESIYAALVSAYRSGDWTRVHAEWDAFESTLRAHMRFEEADILPAFRLAHAREAAAIADEHDALRRDLAALGVRVDLHAVALLEVEALITRLRAHAAHEENLLYPWTARELREDEALVASPAA